MKVYRSVCTYIWNDDKFPYVSDDCQLVWFHIFTNPLSSPLGVFRASIAGLAEDKNRNGQWPLERYQKAFREGIREGFIEYDEKALLVAFPKYFSLDHHCNHPQSPNVVMNWGERFNELPASSLKILCYQSLKALLQGKGKAFMEAFSKAFTEPFGKAMPNTDPEPDPDPDPEPEAERKRAPTSDVGWLEELKQNPAYQHIDFVVENGKMDAWLTLPKNKHRKKTRSFILNWLNKIEKPFVVSPKKPIIYT